MTSFKKIFTSILLLTLLLLHTACNKEEVQPEMSEEEIIEIIEPTLKATSGGVVTNLEAVSEELVKSISSESLCDSLLTYTTGQTYEGQQLEASYLIQLYYELNCNLFGVPVAALVSSTSTSEWSTNRLRSEGNVTFSGSVEGLELLETAITIDGDYMLVGDQQADFKETYEINSILNFTLSEVKINKQDFHIESGSAAFTFTGTTQYGTFSQTGDILFNGDGTALLNINGNTYLITIN